MNKPKFDLGAIVYVDMTAVIVGVRENQISHKIEYNVRVGNEVLVGISEDYLLPTPKPDEEPKE